MRLNRRHGSSGAMHQFTSIAQDPTELATALKSRGYLKVRSDPDVTAAVTEVLNEAEAFFSLPLELKHRNALGDLCEGYRGLGTEYSDVEERPDLHES